jgi:hypothetical protein
VVAVQTNPPDGAALARECSTEHKEVLQPLGNLETAVGDEAMPPKGNSEAARHPVEEDHQANGCPAKVLRQKCHDGCDVHRRHKDNYAPVWAQVLCGRCGSHSITYVIDALNQRIISYLNFFTVPKSFQGQIVRQFPGPRTGGSA